MINKIRRLVNIGLVSLIIPLTGCEYKPVHHVHKEVKAPDLTDMYEYMYRFHNNVAKQGQDKDFDKDGASDPYLVGGDGCVYSLFSTDITSGKDNYFGGPRTWHRQDSLEK